MQSGKLSIVTAMHKEANNVDAVMNEAVTAFFNAFEDFKIIAIEAGSAAETWVKIENAPSASRTGSSDHQP